MRKPLTIIAVALAVLALAASAAAQNQPAQKAPPTVVTTNAKDFGSIEGAKLYEAYCASCHGRDGKGNGPAAKAMPTAVPDLTQLKAANPNADCFRHVLAELQQGHRGPDASKVSDRDLDMPNWGPIFRSLNHDPAIGYLRLRNVAQYVSQIQATR